MAEHHQTAVDQPFPLKRSFYLGVLPALILFMVGLVFSTLHAVRSATMEVYLQLATRQAEGIAEGVAMAAPDAWRRMLSGVPLYDTDMARLADAFAAEQREARVEILKVYGRDGRAVYATEAKEIGAIENKAALHDAFALGVGSVLIEQHVPEKAIYEVYVPYRTGSLVAAVFELYEPVSNLDALLWRVSQPAMLIPSVLLLSMLGALAWLVGRAQSDIDLRTGIIVTLRRRLERLVSRKAVATMRGLEEETVPTEAVELSLYYSDVRGFTAYSESHTPTETIAFLNRIIGSQVEIIEAHGGDIDKIIGDAVLARFDGEHRTRRAVQAAIAVQSRISSGDFPCSIGIGVFTGVVVAGAIGVGERIDYTIIGDSVNIAARLCALAKTNTIVADSQTVRDSGISGFGQARQVSVRGRRGKIGVRSMRIGQLHSKAFSELDFRQRDLI